MITIIRWCVACYVFFLESDNLNFWQIFIIFRPRPWKKIYISWWILPYLPQMITSMRECVAYNDLWTWPISSRSFSLGLENRVRSVASTVLDVFFPYLIQMITIMRRCVAWSLTLTYIFMVIRPWLWKSCPLCNVLSFRSIISILTTNNHYH